MAALFRDIGTNINACSVLCHACIHLLAYMHACGAGVQAHVGFTTQCLYAKLAASTHRLLDSILFFMNEVLYC